MTDPVRPNPDPKLSAPTPGPARDRIAKIFLVLGLVMIGSWVASTWNASPVEYELVHRFEDGGPVGAEQVEVMVFASSTLHADATFYRTDSMEELVHSIHVPPGTYEVRFQALREFGDPEFQLIETVELGEPGRYFLSYQRPDTP
ncbi:MAG: hypothetical protein KC561_02885 [Myxococcales bacterium]|nr:hypothetical protein [Myxococcales bacterium]